jgi:hypothetical protein
VFAEVALADARASDTNAARLAFANAAWCFFSFLESVTRRARLFLLTNALEQIVGRERRERVS